MGSSSADFFDPCLYPDQLVDTNNLDHRVFTRGVSASGGDRRNEDNKSEKCNSTEVKEKLAGNTTKNQRKEKCISNCDSNSNSHSNGDMNTVSESSCGKNRHINDKPHSKHHQQRNPRLNPYYHHRYQRTRFELHPNKRIYKGVGNNDRVNDVPLYADMRYNKLLVRILLCV